MKSKKQAIGRVLAILGGIGAIVVFFFGTYVVSRNEPKFVYYAPGEFFQLSRGSYERTLDIIAEFALCAIPHLFGLLVILYCVYELWKKQAAAKLIYIVNYVFTILTIAMILHNLAVQEVLTLTVYRTHFWGAFLLATILTILIHVGLDLMTKSKYAVVLALQLVMALGALAWFINFFAELKSLSTQPDRQPVGLYVAVAAYFFIAVGIVFLYLAELDRKRSEKPALEEARERRGRLKEPELEPAAAVAPADLPPPEGEAVAVMAPAAEAVEASAEPVEEMVPAEAPAVPGDVLAGETVVPVEEGAPSSAPVGASAGAHDTKPGETMVVDSLPDDHPGVPVGPNGKVSSGPIVIVPSAPSESDPGATVGPDETVAGDAEKTQPGE